jgi:hypothetical protein
MMFSNEPCGQYSRLFRHDGANSILLEKDMGVVNGHIAVGTPYGDTLSVAGLYAPPYVSSDFVFHIRLFGEKVKTERYVWYPNMIFREGQVNGCAVSSCLFLMKGRRAAILRVGIKNKTGQDCNAPLTATLEGGLDFIRDWGFAKPRGDSPVDQYAEPRRIIKRNNDKHIIVGTLADGLRWFDAANLWEGRLALPQGQETVLYFTISMGSEADAYASLLAAEKDPTACEEEAKGDLEARAAYLFERLPRFTSDNKELQDYYDRSLVHYLTNEWNVDEFHVNPYFSTGSINGGCLCSYLYDFSAGWKIHPLYKPDAFKEQMKVYLKLDITKCYAFLPVGGNANGPWYPVNQEKIIGLAYFHVLYTGDRAFLEEVVDGKTVMEHLLKNALLGVKPGEPITLMDYGQDGEHHLELGKGYPYNGVLPDLNARRYMSFVRAAALCEVAGKPADAEKLLGYARELKKLVRESLWCDEKKWFRFISRGVSDFRYTVQMFKLSDSGVLDPDMLEGLLSHLNEEEFLSEFGLHSMSKLDPAFDQFDIDNGGGGICTIFPNRIAEMLYDKNKVREADDILSRVLWWGQRVPYWGDSMVANYIDYRQHTPLQCTIGGVTGAQCIIFGLMGVNVSFDGTVTVRPTMPKFARETSLTGLKIAGKTIDIHCDPTGVTVLCGGKETKNAYGQTIVIPA